MRVGALSSSLTPGALQTVRANAANNAWEVFTPQESFTAQTANRIFAGPASGSAAVPTFRAVVALDLGTSATSVNFLRGDLTFANPLTIGAAVAGGGANRILYEDGSQNLAANANFIFNGTAYGQGTTNPGTINGVGFASVIHHVKSAGGTYAAIDAAGAAGLLLNDSSQSANSRLWALLNYNSVFSIATFSDAGAETRRFSINRSGQTVVGSITPLASEMLSVLGAGGTSYINADFIIRNSSSTGKGIYCWYDTANSAGRIQAANYFTSFDNLSLQGQGGNVIIGAGAAVGTALLQVFSTSMQLEMGYSATQNWKATTDLAGITTFDALGTTPKFIFSDVVEVPDDAYHATNWNGLAAVLTKNAFRDKIENMLSKLLFVDTILDSTGGSAGILELIDTGNADINRNFAILCTILNQVVEELNDLKANG